MRVGFVGTGTMGNPMARCLIEAVHQLTVYDIRREATTNLCEMGASWADSPRNVAESSQVVFTSLPGPDQVTQAVLEPDSGILGGLARGGVIIDTTTNSPTVSRRVSTECRRQGVEMLDAPVSGRPPGMTVMAGGDLATFNEFRPLLESMAGNIFYLGGSGAGCITKLVTQYLEYSNFVTAVEGLIIGAKAGVDLGLLAQVVPVSAGASRVFDNIPRSVLTGEFVSGGTLDIVAKDLHLACEMARDAQAPSAMGNIADDVFQRGQALGWGQEGFAMAARVLEEMAVNGGGMLDHCGGEKVYHQGSSASARVRANCSGRMSPGQPKRQTGWGIRTGSGATYASSGSWEPALSLLRLRR